jgi:DNA-binding beta-propeller fold protein YncE
MAVAPKIRVRYADVFGTIAAAGAGFRNPIDLVIKDDGEMFVLNRGDFRSLTLGQGIRVTRCNIDGTFINDISEPGSGEGQLLWPTSIAVDAKNNVYVSDEYHSQVQIFSPEGTLLGKWGTKGSEAGQLNRPSAILIDGDTMLVSDHLNNRIQRFTLDGAPISSFGEAGSGDGQFNMPWGLALDSDRNIYVADWRNDRIQKFSPEGKHLQTIGSSGSGDGQLNRPSGVGVDKDGNVWVADWGNDRVVIFDRNGDYQQTLLGEAGLSDWANAYLASNQHIIRARAEAAPGVLERESRFRGPTTVRFDAKGRALIPDSCRHRIQIYERV